MTGPAGRRQAPNSETPYTVIVREVVEFRVVIDPTDPQWEWVRYVENPIDELNDTAGETDGPIEQAIRAHDRDVIGAWREVEHDDDLVPADAARSQS